LAILYRDIGVEVDAAFARPVAAGAADPVGEAALVSATEAGATGTAAQVRCNIAASAVAAAAPSPQPNIVDFRRDAEAIAVEAAVLRSGDTWAMWKAHFEMRCSGLAVDYALLKIDVQSVFNWPKDQPDPNAAVTQDLLDAATTAAPASGRPQIQCEVDS
jgi:hypothetical protein